MAETRPLRLLIAVTSPLSLLMLAGQPAFLRRHGFEVTVAAGSGRPLADLAESEDVRVLELPWERGISPLGDLLSLGRLFWWLRRNRPLIVNAGTPKAGLIAALAGVLARVPCRVYVLHGLRYETFTGMRRALLFASDWIACRCCHRVYCVSDSVRHSALAAGLTRSQQSTVIAHGSCNGIDADRYEPTAGLAARSAAARRSLDIPANAPVLGFVGRLARDKGIHELLLAFERLKARVPDLRLLVLGDPDPVDPLEESELRILRERQDIVCTGFVDDPETYYGIMDVFVLPTYREGFPTTVLEAQAAGKPVVTTTATGAVDSIVDGVTGILVPPRDVEALCGAIERLLLDPVTATRMGTAGRERVLRYFQRQQVWNWLLHAYRDLLSTRGLPVPETASPVSGAAREVVR
ncbi:MAG TPA: glycosyltransferase family 4 protein [Terriglobales bacterium]|nr:glycosyltransferase family 4 protein [Terriglobales bacterium]